MAVSLLVLYTSGQIGSTYGEYNTSLQQSSSIEFCPVFPGQIEQLLSELSGHIYRILELKSSLASHNPAGDYTGPADIAALSPDELDQTEELISARLSSANSAIAAIDGQLSINHAIWQQILQEASSAAAILYQTRNYMLKLEPNCLEIRDAHSFRQIQQNGGQSGVLSEPLKDTYNEIVNDLSAIHAAGSVLPGGNPDRGILRQAESRFPEGNPLPALMSEAYDAQPYVSAELQAAYEQLNTDLTSARSSLSAAVDRLQNQQLELTEAQAQLQNKEPAEEPGEAEQDNEDTANEENKAVDTGIPDNNLSVQEPPAGAPVPVTETNKGGDE